MTDRPRVDAYDLAPADEPQRRFDDSTAGEHARIAFVCAAVGLLIIAAAVLALVGQA